MQFCIIDISHFRCDRTKTVFAKHQYRASRYRAIPFHVPCATFSVFSEKRLSKHRAKRDNSESSFFVFSKRGFRALHIKCAMPEYNKTVHTPMLSTVTAFSSLSLYPCFFIVSRDRISHFCIKSDYRFRWKNAKSRFAIVQICASRISCHPVRGSLSTFSVFSERQFATPRKTPFLEPPQLSRFSQFVPLNPLSIQYLNVTGWTQRFL